MRQRDGQSGVMGRGLDGESGAKGRVARREGQGDFGRVREKK